VLHYALLDLVTPARDKHTAGKPVISLPVEKVFEAVYLPSPAAKWDRLISPAWAPNSDGISGIAPALVITCELDQLHDEGVAYAGMLAAAGALSGHVDLAGVDHGYNIRGGDRALVEDSYAQIAKHVIAATAGAGDLL
jgi:acetyl esterase